MLVKVEVETRRLENLLIGRAKAPHNAQLVEVIRADLGGGRVLGAAQIRGVVRPIDRLGRGYCYQHQPDGQGAVGAFVHSLLLSFLRGFYKRLKNGRRGVEQCQNPAGVCFQLS